MTSLKKRLQNLEAQREAKPRWVDFTADVLPVALTKLCPEDRERVTRVGYCVNEPGLFERWDAALAAAFDETKCPYRFTADDFAWF